MKNKPTFSLCTLGCKVNQYESQAIAEDFEKLSYCLRSFDDFCDVYVINTCTVTSESDRKSRQMIRRAVKNGNNNAIVVVAGCFSQAQKDKILEIDGVTLVYGNSDKNKIASDVNNIITSDNRLTKVNRITDINKCSIFDNMSITRSERTRAFIKIVDGCENKCSYCIIPSVRGKIRSKSPNDIISELNVLASNGYKEVVLTGIETAAYGKDLCDTTLPHILSLSSKIDGIERIRLGSLEPTVIKDDFINTFIANEKIVPHFHLSLQSGSDSVLAGMRRKYNTGMFFDKLCALRSARKNVTFTTDVIVGFPGETEEMFLETAEFIKKCAFLYVHIFPYSERQGTDAAKMENKVPESVKKDRAHRLKEVMLESRKSVLKSCDGLITTVLVEEVLSDGSYMGHTPNYIEVKLYIDKHSDVIGKIIDVKLKYVEDTTDYMLCTAI